MEMLTAYMLWGILGLVIGAGGRLLYPGPQSLSLLAALLIGFFGAIFGGLASWALMDAPQGPFQGAGWALAAIGALLFIWMALANGRRQLPSVFRRKP
jgi:uncharacterized membrane protein YeaQ/YmgE (transglycosylase-associated protein family)